MDPRTPIAFICLSTPNFIIFDVSIFCFLCHEQGSSCLFLLHPPQMLFWWLPYLLGDAAGTRTLVLEHKTLLANASRLLPPIHSNLIPDIEQTLILPLLLLALREWMRNFPTLLLNPTRVEEAPHRKKSRKCRCCATSRLLVLVVVSIGVVLVPLVLVFRGRGHWTSELGPVIASLGSAALLARPIWLTYQSDCKPSSH
jgi:hypothetical protein